MSFRKLDPINPIVFYNRFTEKEKPVARKQEKLPDGSFADVYKAVLSKQKEKGKS